MYTVVRETDSVVLWTVRLADVYMYFSCSPLDLQLRSIDS